MVGKACFKLKPFNFYASKVLKKEYKAKNLKLQSEVPPKILSSSSPAVFTVRPLTFLIL
jgi:hypothetical protein